MALQKSSATFPWRCTSCFNAMRSSRKFSTTSPARKLGPESPKYITIPEPVQSRRAPRRRTKGVLPVPRDIFSRREGGVNKVTPEYIAAATQESKTPSSASGKEAPFVEWRKRMAAKRRQNLREGLNQLKGRRIVADAQRKAKADSEAALRRMLLEAEERDDERFTRSTTTLSTTLDQKGTGLPDPDREERIAAMKERVCQKEAQKAVDRQDALHTLYMHARHFITTGSQLDAAIERVFGTQLEPAQFGYNGQSMWSRKLPESVQDKLHKANGTRGTFEDKQGITDVTSRRLRRIAEELTGGKM